MRRTPPPWPVWSRRARRPPEASGHRHSSAWPTGMCPSTSACAPSTTCASCSRGADHVRAVVDTGQLVAGAYRRDRAHRLAATLLTDMGRDALVPEPVVVETD